MTCRLAMLLAAGCLLVPVVPSPPAGAADGREPGAGAPAGTPGLEARVVLGGALVPDHLGSDDRAWQPYPEADVSRGNIYAKLRGARLRVNVVDDPNWHAGPFVAYRRDRNEVEDRRVEVMDGVDPAVEAGGFLEYEHSVKAQDPRYAKRLRLTVRHDVTGAHDGMLATLRGTIQRPLLRPLIGAVSVGLTYASEDYMATYFGVTPAEAARTGFRPYDAGGGFRDVNVAVALNQFLSRTWSITGRVSYTRLLGNAADSPVVEEAGSVDQVVLTLGAGYRF